MSHSTFVKDDDGRDWVLIHNGDWSGDVVIRLVGYEIEEHVLPGAVIRKACTRAVVADLISLIEANLLVDEHGKVKAQR
jgi:hypothetical protein